MTIAFCSFPRDIRSFLSHSQYYTPVTPTRLYSASIEDYRRRIDEYLSARTRMKLSPITESALKRAAGGESSGLDMLQPSGFYRDETPEKARFREEKRRGPMARFERIVAADARIPKQPHPLSFIELERHGFSDLISPIVDLGGPHEVGRMIGLNWIEPEEEEYEVDESKRPKRVESYPFDMKGSLALGGAFEEKMEAAERLNLAEVDIEYYMITLI